MPPDDGADLAALHEWALRRLGDAITVTGMARQMHMAPRIFARWFGVRTGTTPQMLRRHFTRRLGISPQAYRRRFTQVPA
jgi:transcriptional regulator GlxA family with amidase domain